MADIKSSLFGTIAVAGGYITDAQLAECLEEQYDLEKEGTSLKLGKIMKQRGYIDDTILQEILNVQKSLTHGLFGEIAVRFKFATPEQIEKALTIQKNGRRKGYEPGLIGEIMVEQGFLEGDQVLRILDAQRDFTLKCPDCGMKYNAWNFKPGQEINCALCGKLITFNPTFVFDEDKQALVDADPVSDAAEVTEEESMFPDIPGYTIEAQLGRSEDSILYEAIQDVKHRKVTLELMIGISISDKEFMERLQTEAKLAIALHHPAIKNIYAIGKHKGHPYIVTEYVESQSLYNVLQRETSLPLLGATEILMQIIGALKIAHEIGLAHGDIKPSLILFLEDGAVKISRLGVAKKFKKDMLSMDERSRLISSYTAPEIIIGKRDPDMRSDIYSLGAVYYHMVTGVVPFNGETPKEIIISISNGLKSVLRDNPQIPPDLADIVGSMLSVDREDRYQDYDVLLSDLAVIRNDLSGSGIPRMIPPGRRKTEDAATVARRGNLPKRTTESLGSRGYTTPAGEIIRNIEKKEKSKGSVIAVRIIGLIVVVAVGIGGYEVFTETDIFPTEKKVNKDIAVPESAGVEQAAKGPVSEKDISERTEQKSKEKEIQVSRGDIDSLLQMVEDDIKHYSVARQELESLKEKYGDRGILIRALERLENKRVGKARKAFEKVRKDIPYYMDNNEFQKAMEEATEFINNFRGLDEAKEVEELRLQIPAAMTERYFMTKEEIARLVGQQEYDKAMELVEAIINKFGSNKWVAEAKKLRSEIEQEKMLKEGEADMSLVTKRLRLIIETNNKLLSKLKYFDLQGAAKLYKQFLSDPEGKVLEKFSAAMKEEITLVAALKKRIISMINKGVIVKDVKAPGSPNGLRITSADTSGVTAGPLTLRWKALSPDVLMEIARQACNINNGTHMAELAVVYLATGNSPQAVTWLKRGSAKGYATEVLSSVFPTKEDREAEIIFKEALEAINDQEWDKARGILQKLLADYSETSVVIAKGHDSFAEMIKKCEENLTDIEERQQHDEKQKREKEKEEEKKKAQALKGDEINLNFFKFSDIRYIQAGSGIWRIEDQVLAGKNEPGKSRSFYAKIEAKEPFFIEGKIKFKEINAAVSITVGETKMQLDIANNVVYYFDSLKTRRRLDVQFNVNRWYDFQISIDRQGKDVLFVFAGTHSQGTCDVFSDGIELLCDQENTIYFDDLKIRAASFGAEKTEP